jgi:hypothetical protein
VTVQFNKATSDGVVTAADMQAIADQIHRVYEDGDYVGSLVVDGPSDRPTEHEGSKAEPEGWGGRSGSASRATSGFRVTRPLMTPRSLGAVAWHWLSGGRGG